MDSVSDRISGPDLGRALVVQGDAAHLPLPDNSVDLICTSPPYFALRSYQDGGQHYAGQVGSEATPQEFLDALWACTAEWVRVLKPSGSIFVNLGDKYAGANAARYDGGPPDQGTRIRAAHGTGIPNKSLMLLPERYRIGCVDRLGLIARAVIIWSKPNGLPESVTDRVRRSHEDWVHLTKEPRYYSAVDDIREAQRHVENGRSDRGGAGKHSYRDPARHDQDHIERTWQSNPLGKLPGSVWTIPTEPLQLPDHLGVDHFAAYPTEWPRRIIQGWSPRHVCTQCGEGRRPDVTASYEHVNFTSNAKVNRGAELHEGQGKRPPGVVSRKSVTVTGWVCACTPHTNHPGTGGGDNRRHGDVLTDDGTYLPNFGAGTGTHDNLSGRPKVGPWREYHYQQWTPPPARPGVVLDPFGGTGTTALVARALGRDAITVDLSHDYGRVSRWRTTDPGQLAKVLGYEKPAVQVTGQTDLFEEASA